MESIKSILVGLDQTEVDKTLIEFASFISLSSHVKSIYFLNVLRNLSVPNDILEEFPDLINNALAERKKQLKEYVNKYIKVNSDVEIEIIVKSGSGLKTFLSEINKFDIDLVVIGRKDSPKMSGILVQRLARRAGTNLLIVPEGGENNLKDLSKDKKVIVPADFSKHSSLALEHAIEIATISKTKVEIICQHVYSVPIGYHYSGKSHEEFAEILKQNAEKYYDSFIKNVDAKGIKITPVCTLDEDDDLVENIYKLALDIDADGIIFGAKGISAVSALFLGSIAEKMIKLDTKFPLMVVRRKGENANILDYIKEM